MFLVNSRSASFVVTPTLRRGRPYPEVTAVVLQSSLAKVLSYALVYSTYPPVSVSGTDMYSLALRAFSRHPIPWR